MTRGLALAGIVKDKGAPGLVLEMQSLVDHHHCKTCGNPCDPTEDTCSVECAERRKAALDSRRTTTYVLYGIMALIVLLFLVSYVRL